MYINAEITKLVWSKLTRQTFKLYFCKIILFFDTGRISGKMAETKQQKIFKRWITKLKDKNRLVILNDETLEEKFSFRLSRLNVFILIGSIAILLVFITSYIIAFTPLKEYIPGFGGIAGQRDWYKFQLRLDSLEVAMKDKDLYIYNIKNIIANKEIVDELPEKAGPTQNYKDIDLKNSPEDSMLREEVENAERFSLEKDKTGLVQSNQSALGAFLFFVPVKGTISNSFDSKEGHYGIDIVAKRNEAIKSVLDGTVIFSDWTLETGYSIGIQHTQNMISIYRHNSSLLKKQGAYVRAGEPIAIIGNTGEMSSGPHLHFELWYNGSPVNPKNFIAF